MKNFRKVLALILVVATLFSFAAMTSAKEYKDADKISYDEAVDVLSAIGILNGYDDGTFKPTDSIAREEMAKMIGVLSNAGDDVSDLYASACTFADTKDRWSASYVAYCAQLGIVAGRNASTFDPRGKVTGIETAKMLLCVLGFDASTQGYVGSSWKTNVLRDAKNFGLLDNFASDYDPDKAITREEAAQMMLNALEANIVIGTVSDNLVKISNAIYFDKYGAQISLPDAENEGWIVIYKNVVISWEPLASIYKGLTLLNGVDCYGNPGQLWTYENSKGTVVFQKFYADEADYTYTKAATLTTDLKSEIDGRKNYEVVLYVDGTLVETNGSADKTELGDLAAHWTGNGVETKVYVMDNPALLYSRVYGGELFDTDNDGIIFVTVKNTYIGKVADVSTRYSTFDIVDADGKVIADNVDNTDFDFADGDMVLYWVCNGEINAAGYDFGKNRPVAELEVEAHDLGSVAATTTVVGAGAENDIHDVQLVEPTKAYVSYVRYNAQGNAENKFTADGKDYRYAENYAQAIEPGASELVRGDEGTDKNIYTDLFGYVMYVTDYTEDKDWQYAYFVEDTWFRDQTGENQSGPIWNCTADFVDFEAKYHDDQKVNYALTSLLDYEYNRPFWNPLDKEVGVLVRYYVDDDGVIVWDRDEDNVAEVLTGSQKAFQLSAKTAEIVEDELYGSSTTKYLLRYYDYDKKDFVYSAWTGYRNIPADYGTMIFNGNETYLQYFDLDGDEVAEYVFVDASYTSADQDFYILGKAYDAAWDKINIDYSDYEVYFALVDGKESVVAYNGDQNLNTTGDWVHGLYNGSMVALGVDLTVETDNGEGSYPLYVVIDDYVADYVAMDGVLDISNDLVTLVNIDGDSGAQTTTYKKQVSENGVKVYDVIYTRENGYWEYVDFEVTENDFEDELTAKNCRTWILEDSTGVYAIYREVEETR